MPDKTQHDLWALVQKINTAWHSGHTGELAPYFHDEVVFNSPDFKHQIKGKENCVRTYTDFMSTSEVLFYNESNPKVHTSGDTAVVTYDFEMKYEQNNQTHHERGTDILVFNRDPDGWKVIWRGLSNLAVVETS